MGDRHDLEDLLRRCPEIERRAFVQLNVIPALLYECDAERAQLAQGAGLPCNATAGRVRVAGRGFRGQPRDVARGLITLDVKSAGKPGAGERHAGLDVVGAGNVIMGAGLRASAKVLEVPPDPNVDAPVPDPT
jgi:hypothetical protein